MSLAREPDDGHAMRSGGSSGFRRWRWVIYLVLLLAAGALLLAARVLESGS